MKLLESTKSKITKNENGENVPNLEINAAHKKNFSIKEFSSKCN